jgi:hypothetical protein
VIFSADSAMTEGAEPRIMMPRYEDKSGSRYAFSISFETCFAVIVISRPRPGSGKVPIEGGYGFEDGFCDRGPNFLVPLLNLYT